MEIKLPAFEESLAYSDPVELPNYYKANALKESGGWKVFLFRDQLLIHCFCLQYEATYVVRISE